MKNQKNTQYFLIRSTLLASTLLMTACQQDAFTVDTDLASEASELTADQKREAEEKRAAQKLYPSNATHQVVIHNGTIYATHRQGLSISKTGGDSWQNLKMGCTSPTDDPTACLGRPGARGLMVDSSGQIVLSLLDGLASSPAAPIQLSSIALPEPALCGKISIEYMKQIGSTWLAAPTVCQHLHFGVSELLGLYVSHDAGAHWSWLPIPSSYYGSSPVLQADAKNGFLYALLGNGAGEPCLKKSNDDGATWSDITPPQIHGSALGCLNRFTFVDDRLVAVGNHTGVFISDDFGGTWSRKTVADGLAVDDKVNYLAYDGSRRLWVGGWKDNRLSFSDDAGDTWQSKTIDVADFNLTSDIVAEGNLVVLGSYNTGMAVSKDGGASFSKVSSSCKSTPTQPYCPQQ